MKDLGHLRHFLGVEAAKIALGIVVSQRKYVLDLLRETSRIGCRPADTLREPNNKLRCDEGNKVDQGQYLKRRQAEGYYFRRKRQREVYMDEDWIDLQGQPQDIASIWGNLVT